jgi:hypothetical protein
MLSESLTVRILGDSSHLRAELEGTLGLLDAFEKRLAGLGTVGERLSAGLGGVSAALGPLELVNQLLTGAHQRMEVIRQTPLTINVQPALAALLKLSTAIEAVAARLTGLATASSGAAAKGAVPQAVASPAAAIAAAVPGPSSPVSAAAASAVLHDRSPMPPSFSGHPLKAAGEFLSRLGSPEFTPRFVAVSEPRFPGFSHLFADASPAPAVVQPFLEDFRRPEGLLPLSRTTPAPPPMMTTNHFGGITIQVRETADVSTLVRDLRLQGIHLRNRRG